MNTKQLTPEVEKASVGPTPGPWRHRLLGPRFVEVLAESGPPVVKWSGFDDIGRTLMEHEANARLIAAAPDLLAALKECIGWIDPDEHGLAHPDLARADLALCEAAVAKAEGRQP